MSVHWTPEGRNTRHRTIYHSRPYCHCPDGRQCDDASWRKDPKTKGRKTRRAERRLAARTSDFEKTKFSDSEKRGRRKPGSIKAAA